MARSPGADRTEEPARRLFAPELFYRSSIAFLRDLPGTAKRFWVLVVATGTAAGLGAALLVQLLGVIEGLAWPAGATLLESVRAASPVRRVVVLATAGLLVSVLMLVSRRSLRGHGTSSIVEAIWVRAGRMAIGRAFGRALVAITAVGMGAPLGREGAVLTTGAATGSWLGTRLRLPADQVRLLVACGGAAGLSAAYNVPIGGALFGLEVLLGSLALELFGPIVISCVTATLVSRVLIGDQPSFLIPSYALGTPAELLLYLAVAPVLGTVAGLYVRAIDGAARVFDRLPGRLTVLAPPLALALIGGVAVLFPEILGNGYQTVNEALLGRVPILLLLLLPLLKTAATALASGAGVPGGLFTPSLYVGALLGSALGYGVNELVGGDVPPGAFALLGMSAILAGTTHAAVSSVLIIFEMTGDYAFILPLMVASAIASGVSRRVERENLYTAPLRRRNVVLPEPPRPHWLRAVRIAAFVSPSAERIDAAAPFSAVTYRLLALPPGQDLYVVRPDGTYAGVIVLDRLKASLPDEGDLRAAIAADVMVELPPLAGDLSLAEAAARFAETDLDKLPVVHPATGELLGSIAKGDVIRRGRF